MTGTDIGSAAVTVTWTIVEWFAWDWEWNHEYYRQLLLKEQAPVVQTLDSAIHRITIYPVDDEIRFTNTYPLDSDLSGR